MPLGAIPMAVGCQIGGGGFEELVLWALVDPVMTSHSRTFVVAGTGHPIERIQRYIGTVQMPSGLVWHVFEVYP